ncbi:MAG: flippase-like domain-containing protein [Epsilonproteobacteria bacterium]|nr:flippase-like domain-containing protein [Campylobacterota bacterium]
MKKLSKYFRIIGLFILIYILSTLEYKKLFTVLLDINIYYILVYMLSYYIFFVAKVLRFSYILKFYGYNPAYINLFGAMIESQYFGFITPSRVGESIRIIYLQDRGNIPKKASTLAYLYDRFQDLYFMALMGILSFIFILKLPVNTYLIIFASLMIFLFFFKNKIMKMLAKKFKVENITYLSLKSDLYLFFQNCFIYFFYFLQYYCLALSLGVEISFLYLSAVAVIGALASLIPISISGLGIREGIFIYYLVKIGISKEAAFLISFLDNFGFSILFVVLMHLVYKIITHRKHNVANR